MFARSKSDIDSIVWLQMLIWMVCQENSDQADNDGFNDGKTLGDACENMVIKVIKPDEGNAKIDLGFRCLSNDVLNGACTFKVDGVELNLSGQDAS